jgi:hypothetical protein
MIPKARPFVAALFWMVATSAAVFVGGAATILACSQRTGELWIAVHTLVLVPSIFLYFLLDWWRPESRAKWFGLAAPFFAAACLLAVVADVLPHPYVNGTIVGQHALALAGSLGAVFLVVRVKRRVKAFAIPRFQFGLSSLFILATLAALL